MDKKNNLSGNLRAYQNAKKSSLTEFSRELGVPKSTLQSILRDGNTTLDTAIRLAEGLGVTLDELVRGDQLPGRFTLAQSFLHSLEWYASLPPEKREKVAGLISELMKAVSE